MSLVSLFDFCYVKGERQFVHMHTMEAFGGNGGTAPLIPNLGTRWKRAVSFAPQQTCTSLPLGTRLSGTQRWSGCCGEERNCISILKIEPRFLGRPNGSLVTIPNELSRCRRLKLYKTDQLFTAATRRDSATADLPY
jgi:hypothetical protein